MPYIPYKLQSLLTKTRYVLFSVFASLLFILTNRCSVKELDHKIHQGTITYDISYTNNSGRSFPVQLLPKTLEMKFNSHFSSYTIEDRVGLFSISNVTDLKKTGHYTLIKVFDKKYIYKGGPKETPVFFKTGLPYQIKFLPDTLRLAGMLCKKAMVSDAGSFKFDIFYTTFIDVPSSNMNTPYEKVDGVLLMFQIRMKNLDMKLTAKKISPKEIKDSEFLEPEGYKLISKTQMEEIINTLLP
jgi:hypothetical protein